MILLNFTSRYFTLKTSEGGRRVQVTLRGGVLKVKLMVTPPSRCLREIFVTIGRYDLARRVDV